MGNENNQLDVHLDQETSRRPRSATLLCLKMFVDMFRKSGEIKSKVNSGDYKVDSEKLAKSLINKI